MSSPGSGVVVQSDSSTALPALRKTGEFKDINKNWLIVLLGLPLEALP
jgi:hypothetical protein